jgi:GMP synthase-like glutamine amidotransferase
MILQFHPEFDNKVGQQLLDEQATRVYFVFIG